MTWLNARRAALGMALMLVIATTTCMLINNVVPTPFSFMRSTPFDVPFGSFAPVSTAVAIGLLLKFQSTTMEQGSIRPLAWLDTALHLGYSVALLVPFLVLLAFGQDQYSVIAACRAHVFVLWAILIGAHLVGTKLSVVTLTFALLVAPTFLPFHLRADPPGLFITLASGRSVDAAILAAVTCIVGMCVLASRGLPAPG